MIRPPPYTPNRRALDPRKGNISCDANVFYWDGTARDHLVDRFCKLRAEGVLSVVIAGGVRPNTPDDIKAAISAQIFNLRPDLNADQKAQRRRVKEILTDNAMPGKHDADALHLSEAAETRCMYFITQDKRILDKRGELRAALPPTLSIVTLSEFFEIFNDYAIL